MKHDPFVCYASKLGDFPINACVGFQNTDNGIAVYTKLVYYEITTDVESAIRREKQLKDWHRDWRINQFSHKWDDSIKCL
jgi:hypothetical protein